jgi:hypothetical protein
VKSADVNRWLTLVANLAVLVGIILILIELDQNAGLMRAQMSQARSDQLRQSYEARVHSEYWPEIVAKVDAVATTQEWIDSLTTVEFERVRVFYLGVANDLANQYYLCDEGYLDQLTCESGTKAQLRRSMAIFPYVLTPRAGLRIVKPMQELAAEQGDLPYPNDDGSWTIPKKLALPAIFLRHRNPDFRFDEND